MIRLDTNQSAFFKRELEKIKAQTYDVKYKELKAMQYIPVDTSTPSGTEFITWRSYSKVGRAKIIADYAHDFPRVDIYGTENTSKVYDLGSSYGYSIKEIRRSQITGKSLDTRRAEAARRSINELFDDLAWNGNTAYNIQGFLDYPGITSVTRTTGAGGDTWALKTPDEIIADLTAICNGVSTPTKGIWEVNQILLPRTQYNRIKNLRMTDGNTHTVLTYFLANNPGVSVDVVDLLSTAGASGVTRMMAYVKDPVNLVQEIPQMFEQLEEDKKGMEYEIPCHGEFGGVTVYYPESVAYMDNI